MPEAFYTGTTGVEPIDQTIRKLLKTGYNHHIERLMVLGNFMLLCEIKPDAVYRWFMEMYIDAYDWVMVPNIYGMSQFSDGGLMTTKPYICGSNYILKMSDYPKGEWHEISILFAAYLVKLKGHKLIYLGQNTPDEDLQIVYRLHQPEFLMTVITTSPNSEEVQDYIYSISERFKNSEIIFEIAEQNIRSQIGTSRFGVVEKERFMKEINEKKYPYIIYELTPQLWANVKLMRA